MQEALKTQKSKTSNTRWALAMGVAAISDLVCLPTHFLPPLQVAVDLVTALAIWALLGWRWSLLIAVVPEAIPGLLQIFPAWMLVVGSLWVLDRRQAPPS